MCFVIVIWYNHFDLDRVEASLPEYDTFKKQLFFNTKFTKYEKKILNLNKAFDVIVNYINFLLTSIIYHLIV